MPLTNIWMPAASPCRQLGCASPSSLLPSLNEKKNRNSSEFGAELLKFSKSEESCFIQYHMPAQTVNAPGNWLADLIDPLSFFFVPRWPFQKSLDCIRPRHRRACPGGALTGRLDDASILQPRHRRACPGGALTGRLDDASMPRPRRRRACPGEELTGRLDDASIPQPRRRRACPGGATTDRLMPESKSCASNGLRRRY
jgi:hypothetical protein